jgi:DNA-binding transcriptional MerR regulator
LGVPTEYSLDELARVVQDWCKEHKIVPANGQAAEAITERNIRYYRTLGLLDPPMGNYAKTFSEKHRLQLIALRIYQAHGLPLRKIRDELYGKSLDDLAALEKQASKRGGKTFSVSMPSLPGATTESWLVVALSDEFLLISRQNRQLPRSVVEKIKQVLPTASPENETTAESNRN